MDIFYKYWEYCCDRFYCECVCVMLGWEAIQHYIDVLHLYRILLKHSSIYSLIVVVHFSLLFSLTLIVCVCVFVCVSCSLSLVRWRRLLIVFRCRSRSRCRVRVLLEQLNSNILNIVNALLSHGYKNTYNANKMCGKERERVESGNEIEWKNMNSITCVTIKRWTLSACCYSIVYNICIFDNWHRVNFCSISTHFMYICYTVINVPISWRLENKINRVVGFAIYLSFSFKHSHHRFVYFTTKCETGTGACMKTSISIALSLSFFLHGLMQSGTYKNQQWHFFISSI